MTPPVSISDHDREPRKGDAIHWANEDVGRRGGIIPAEELERVRLEHAATLRCPAGCSDADRGVDDDQPHRGDGMTKIAEGWLSRKAASGRGSQESGGIVRRTWKIGSRPRMAHALPDAAPSGRRPRRARTRMPTRCGPGRHAPAQPHVLRPWLKSSETIRSLTRSDLCRGRGGTGRAGQHLQTVGGQREHDQRRPAVASTRRPAGTRVVRSRPSVSRAARGQDRGASWGLRRGRLVVANCVHRHVRRRPLMDRLFR